MSFWDTIRTSASGLLAQRLRLDVIANNVANAQTTRTAAGGPYQRQDVVFMPAAGGAGSTFSEIIAAQHGSLNSIQGGVQVAAIVTDQTPGQKVYDPSSPDADKTGYVTEPNVDPVVEMTNMISATRSYEANLSVVQADKNMAMQALNIGK
ncbi:MAG: flagellar basal body rod protein FlgC [Anaerolineaceae bacterium]|nr:flagellar basal body rod protein FlgC [Anaerolineaceae bacterium]